MAGFPEQQPGVLYLTEGGQETELMYKHGHELPEFAMYPLLDDPRAVADLTDMYTRYLEIAAAHGFVALMGGLDYRASPDWASKLGISNEGLAEFQLRSIEFLRDVARPFEGQIPQILIAGVVGPRGDAYGLNRTITAEEAEEYHGVQIETLRRRGRLRERDDLQQRSRGSRRRPRRREGGAAALALLHRRSDRPAPQRAHPEGGGGDGGRAGGRCAAGLLRRQLRRTRRVRAGAGRGTWLERLRACARTRR